MLVPHKITALEQSNDPNVNTLNTVSGAAVRLFDSQGQVALLYDDEAGSNPSTTKTTDSSGQVVVWVTPGEYDEAVNGSTLRRVSVGGVSMASYATTNDMLSSRPTKTGLRAENRESGGQYQLAESSYIARQGDVVAGNSRTWQLVGGNVNFNIRYDIPTDFATLQEAVDFTYNKIKPESGNTITLFIENGHEPSSGISASGLDLSQYIIGSSSTVTLDSSFTGDVMNFNATRAPIIDVLFDAVNCTNLERGLVYSNVSRGTVAENKGVINVTAQNPGGSFGNGLFIENCSSVNASGSIFKGCNLRNVHVTTGSTCEISGADVSEGKGDWNVWVSRRSRLVADGMVCSNGLGGGMAVLRSDVSFVPFSAEDAYISNNATDNINVNDASTLYMGSSSGRKVVSSGAGRDNLIVGGSSTVEAEGADLSGAGRNGIKVDGAGRVNAPNCNLSGSTNSALEASRGATVNAENSDCTGYGISGIKCIRGASVNARTANAQQSGADQSTDFIVEDGGSLVAINTTGGKSQAVNVLTSDGIIYG